MDSTRTIHELIRLAVSGNRHAFDEIYERTIPRRSNIKYS